MKIVSICAKTFLGIAAVVLLVGIGYGLEVGIVAVFPFLFKWVMLPAAGLALVLFLAAPLWFMTKAAATGKVYKDQETTREFNSALGCAVQSAIFVAVATVVALNWGAIYVHLKWVPVAAAALAAALMICGSLEELIKNRRGKR